MADGRVPLGPEINVFWRRQTRLLGVRHGRGRRELADERVGLGDGVAKRVEEDARLVDVPHEQVDAELAEHGNVELDVDGVRVEVARHLGRREQTARLGLAHDPRLRLDHVDGVFAVLGADARDEADVGLEVLGEGVRVASGDLVGVLVVKVDQVQRNLSPLLLVALEERLLGEPAHRKVELPPNVPGIVHRRVHALRGLGRVRVAGVSGEEGP